MAVCETPAQCPVPGEEPGPSVPLWVTEVTKGPSGCHSVGEGPGPEQSLLQAVLHQHHIHKSHQK